MTDLLHKLREQFKGLAAVDVGMATTGMTPNEVMSWVATAHDFAEKAGALETKLRAVAGPHTRAGRSSSISRCYGAGLARNKLRVSSEARCEHPSRWA
jgi:hypothetical protein